MGLSQKLHWKVIEQSRDVFVATDGALRLFSGTCNFGFETTPLIKKE